MKIKAKDLKIIINFIKDNFNQGKSELENYLFNSLDEFVTLFDYKYHKDELLEILCDKDGYRKIVTALKKSINDDITHSYTSKIKITKVGCYDYIESTAFASSVNLGYRTWLINKLNALAELEDKQKGDKYEEFCTCFLKDIGFQAITTRSSNDDGIDIIGKIEIPFSEEVLTHFIGRIGLNIIAQVKYRVSQVDTPVIKHLIGDSMFYRFKSTTFSMENSEIILNNLPTCLCVFSHNGFTNEAKKFAQFHGVILIDSNKMADILSSLDKWDTLCSVAMFQ